MLRTGKILVCLVAFMLIGASPAQRGGADVHITFSGLICHVFDAAHAPRAVTMRGNDAMPHRATLYMQEAAIASSEIPLTCDGRECSLDLTNTGLRFVGGGSATFSRGGSFDTIVPALRAITNGEMDALRKEVFDDVPSPASPISSSFLLPAGHLTALAYDAMARYEPDLEGRGVRPFAREVMLDGHVPSGQLLVRQAGDVAWRRITFSDDIDLRVVNESSSPMAGHASLYYELARVPLATRPAITLPAQAGRIRTLDIANVECSDTRFP
jgi:hypothetical protein